MMFNLLLFRLQQLYETSCVRHGFMVVGETGAGKSSNIKVLTTAITRIADNNETLGDSEKIYAIRCFEINPKAQNMDRLYGNFDEATHEWSNGILVCISYALSAHD